MTQKEYLGGVSATNLAADMTNVATTFTVTSGGGTGFPTGNTYPFVVVIGRGTPAEEKILCASRSGDTFTVTTRGYDGSTAVAHTGNPAVEHCIDALVITEASNVAANTLGRIDAVNQFLVSDSSTTLAKKTASQVKTILAIANTDVSGFGTASTKDTGYTAGKIPVLTGSPGTPDGTKFLRDDGTWATGGAVPDNYYVTAGALAPSDGSPSLAQNQNGYAGLWLLDSANTESISLSMLVPTGWATVDIDLYWTNNAGGAGAVVWRCYVDNDAVAAVLGGDGSPTDSTVTAPSQNVIKKSTVATGETVTAGNLLDVLLARVGTDVADTLANDAAVIGINVRKAS